MKIILESHRYAPELNRAYIGPNRTMVPVPGCATVQAVRKHLFSPLKYKGRLVKLQSKNVPEFSSYDRSATGFCNDMRSLSGALRAFRNRHNIPGRNVEVSTRLIG